MFKKMFNILMVMMIVIGFQGCDQAEMPNIGGIVGPGEELYGCEGANMYDWNDFQFETSLDQNETVWIGFDLTETTLFNVVIDQKSIIYLKGIELDFEGGLEGNGFVFKNPLATSTCGCGESFSVT